MKYPRQIYHLKLQSHQFSIYLFQLLGVTASCIVVGETFQENKIQLQTLFNISSLELDPENSTEFLEPDEDLEPLPVPLSMLQPEARNYVAYIPVPLNDDDDEEGSDEDDEYYDDDDDEYYEYEEEEEEKPKRKKENRRKSSSRNKPQRKRFQDKEEDKERVPFLVPLMMVPENQVGVQKEFSFNKDTQSSLSDDLLSNVIKNNPNRRFQNPNIYSSKRIQSGQQSPVFPQGGPVHDRPGPPYRGPAPRNPSLPLDDTIIHPSIHRPVYARPPRRFNANFNYNNRKYNYFNNNNYNRQRYNNAMFDNEFSTTSTTQPPPTTTTTVSTTTEETTKRSPSIIVVQAHQPGMGSPYGYINPYGYQQQQPYYNYQPPQPYPPPQYVNPYITTTTTTTTTTTVSTTTTDTTTKKPRRRKTKKPKVIDPMLSEGSLTIVDNKLVPVKSPELLQKRFGLANNGMSGRRFSPVNRNFRGVRKYQARKYSRPSPYRSYQKERYPEFQHNRRYDLDMPNIFTQSGMDFEHDEKPNIKRPPPKHPGVQLPGIRVPPNAGNIQDIIKHPQSSQVKRYTTQDGKYTLINDYRPPLGQGDYNLNSGGSYKPGKYSQSYNQPGEGYPDPYDPGNIFLADDVGEEELGYDASPPQYPGGSQYQDYQKPFQNDYQPSSQYQPTQPPYRPTPPPSYPKPAQYQPTPPPYQPTPPPYQPTPPPYQPTPPPYQPTSPPYQPTSPPYQQTPPPYQPTPPPYQPTYSTYKPAPPPYQPTQPPYQPPPQSYTRPTPSPYQPTYSQGAEPYAPSKPAYSPPSRPEYTAPSNPSYADPPALSPAYNQDFLTPDPNKKYPGPEIYDNNSVQGPTPVTSYEKGSSLGYDNYGYADKNDNFAEIYENTENKGSPHPPNGPDYSSATILHTGGSGPLPYKVGVDLYPMGGENPLGKHGLSTSFNSEDNKHEILFHLNLFSKKPTSLGGRADNPELSQSLGPFSFGR